MLNKTQSQGIEEKVRSQPRNQPDARKEKEKIPKEFHIEIKEKKNKRTREKCSTHLGRAKINTALT